jgi:adenosylcobinamide-GDP ribazoletransferase
MLKLFLAAVEELTIIPVRLEKKIQNDETSCILRYFPFIGLLFGLCLVAIEYIVSFYLPSSIVTILLIAFMIAISGGRYLEDLACITNLIFSKRTKETGSISLFANPVGSTIVFLFILLKYCTIAEFSAGKNYLIFLFFPMVGRASIVILCWAFPIFETKEGSNIKISNRDFIIVSLSVLLLGLLFTGVRTLFIFGVILLIVILTGKYILRKLPETRKYLPGFINEIAELVALLIGTVVI